MNTSTMRRLVAALAVILAGASGACDLGEALEVRDPEYPTDETLSDASDLPLLIRGALAEFYTAYSGNAGFGFVVASGLFTDELQSSDTFADRNALDRRALQPPSAGNPSDGSFYGLQRARRATQDAAAAVARFRGENDPDRAKLLAINGFALVALAEGWCSAIPMGNVVGGEFVEGAPLTTAQLLDSAVVRFDASLAASPNDLARIGKGRALLGLGRYVEAAAAVNPVPTESRFLVEHSENTFRNPIYALNNDNRRFTILGGEGVNGLDFRTARDPRVVVSHDSVLVGYTLVYDTIQLAPIPPDTLPRDTVVVDTVGRFAVTRGFDDNTPLYKQQKYPNVDADVPFASGVEARLIEAEAALQGDDVATFLLLLNGLRASVVGLPSLVDPGSTAARVDLLFRERAFWMFLTGHRLGDLRRLVTQYGRAPGDVYPVGRDTRNQPFGNDVVFSAPFTEEQNSLFQRDACVTTAP